jgi:hypothetical protein
MQRIVFLEDYSGALTNGITYLKGSVQQLPDITAERLIGDGIVAAWKEAKEKKVKETEAEK